MGSKKVHVFIVTYLPLQAPAVSHPSKRLIRGALKEVEAKLRSEVSIEPCTAEIAHQMSDVQIEDCEGE